MIGIIVLAFFGALFRRRGNSWPKTIVKTAGVYALYLVLIYGGVLGAVSLSGLVQAPRIESTRTPTPTRAASNIVPAIPTMDVPGVILSGPAKASTIAPTAESFVAVDRVGCDPAYPESRTCIPLAPPFDQGCAITTEREFKVSPPDPQGLDHDKDGIGCEPIGGASALTVAQPAEVPAAASGNCDPSYPDVCIPPVWVAGDLDCRDIPYGSFRVIGADPHLLDGPYDGSKPYEPDGLGCEWN